MKTTFTSFMLKSFTILFFVTAAFSLAAQTTHMVAVTDWSFTPRDIIIQTGDKVIWTNTQGSHNVNGSQTAYPNNPESFGNNLGQNWTYEYTFNTPGTYNYQCDPHVGMGMVGSVTVNQVTGTDDVVAAKSFLVYPNPATEYIELFFQEDRSIASEVKLYSVNGRLIEQKVLSQGKPTYRYDLNHLNSGLYFMKVTAGNKTDVVKFLKK